jgi:hypothetical protein
MFWGRQRSLVDLIRGDLERDPFDAPFVSVEADCLAQDMAWMPTAVEPVRSGLRRSPDIGTNHPLTRWRSR